MIKKDNKIRQILVYLSDNIQLKTYQKIEKDHINQIFQLSI